MRRFIRILLILGFTAAISIALGFCACKKEDPDRKKLYALDFTECDLIKFEDTTLTLTADDGTIVSDAIWRSSDENIVSVIGGKIIALNEGIADVTAEYSGETYFCTVKVTDNGMVPSIVLSRESYHLAVGDIMPAETKIIFNDEIYEDAVFTYTVSDKNICSVENGAIIASEAGKTEIIVSAEWRGADRLDLSCKFFVEVKNDLNLKIQQKSLSISTADAEIGGEKFENQASLNAVLTIDGEICTDKEIQWYVSDETLISVSNQGTVTANKEGKTGTAAVWAVVEDQTFFVRSDEIPVTVYFPIVDRSAETELLLDLSDLTAPIKSEDIFGNSLETIERVTEEDKEKNIWNGSGVDLSDSEYGENSLIVYNRTYAVKVKALFASRIIEKAEELHIFDNRSGVVLDGYYILGTDIDASSFRPKVNTWVSNNDGGFGGTFDGRGHNIDNITVTTCGLFGAITSTGCIKNVFFTNVSLTGNVASLLDGSSWGTVENIFIHVKDTVSMANSGGILFDTLKSGNLKNIVVYVEEAASENGYFLNSFNVGAAENVYVVSDCVLQKSNGTDLIEGVIRYPELSDENNYGTFGDGWTEVLGLPVPISAEIIMREILLGGDL